MPILQKHEPRLDLKLPIFEMHEPNVDRSLPIFEMLDVRFDPPDAGVELFKASDVAVESRVDTVESRIDAIEAPFHAETKRVSRFAKGKNRRKNFLDYRDHRVATFRRYHLASHAHRRARLSVRPA